MRKILKRDLIVITILVLLSIYLMMEVKVNFNLEINMKNVRSTICYFIPIALTLYLHWSKDVQK